MGEVKVGHVLILGSYQDKQTAYYILEAFQNLKWTVSGVDIRLVLTDLGPVKAQEVIISEIKELDINVDLILVLKGLELTSDTLVKIKSMFPNAKLVNWFFDKYLADKPIWETTEYFKIIKLFDYYFCSLRGAATKLNELGLSNVKYLDEGFSPTYNKEVYMNSFQEGKYGADVSFVGSLGYFKQHPSRAATLTKVIKEGFNTKIWGSVVCNLKSLTDEIKSCHTQQEAVNEAHSMVCQSSLVNLGIDQDVNLDRGHSARLYRVLACGGLYLCTRTKGLDEMFKVNKEGEIISKDLDLVVYYSEDDLIDKLDFLLEHDEIRECIRRNGQKKVLESHTFQHRISEMIREVGLDGKEESKEII